MATRTITMVPVESGAITAIGYDLDGKMLDIQFKSGETHRHEGVPPQEADAMHAAESKGKYYHQNIRGKYTSSKLPTSNTPRGECPDCGATGTVGVVCEDCGCETYR